MPTLVGRPAQLLPTVSFRGLSAFVAAEIAVPLQVGSLCRIDGSFRTHMPFRMPSATEVYIRCGAGLMLLAELLILLVLYKGKEWREASIDAEKRKYGS
jgi:hypothetical protein